MPDHPARWIVALAVAHALVACSAGESSGPRNGGSAGAGGSAATEPVPDALAFDRLTTLTLNPGQVAPVTVAATPRGAYRVRFALLPDANREPNDASLDRAEAITDSRGEASVLLTAPTTPTTFRLRASVGTTVSTELAVSVSEAGFSTVVVHPSYLGKRLVTSWTATVRAGATCASLHGIPPPDGDLVATSDVSGTPTIDSVPVGPALAVTLRAGHFAGGCADLTNVVADSKTDVTVVATDRPLQLETTDLELALGISDESPEWRTSLEASAQQSLDALLDGAPNGVVALLDAMAAQAESGHDAFIAERTSQGWDATLPAALGTDSPQRIQTLVASWMSTGVLGLSQPRTFVGHLGASGEPGQALFELATVADTDAQSAGFAQSLLATWSADPTDTVLLGVNLFWYPSLMVTALSEPPALLAAPGTTTVPEALASLLSCSDVSNLMTAQSTVDSYPGCDQACTESLCQAGLAFMWQRARNASGANASKLEVNATGATTIDDEAYPVSFSGTWIGTATTDTTSAALGGPASGAAPSPPP